MVLHTLPPDVVMSLIECSECPIDTAYVLAHTCVSLASIAVRWLAAVQRAPAILAFVPPMPTLEGEGEAAPHKDNKVQTHLCRLLRMLSSLSSFEGCDTNVASGSVDDLVLDSICTTKLHTLALTNCERVNVTFEGVRSLVHRSPSLAHLTLRSFESGAILASLVERCPLLTHLDVSGCRNEIVDLELVAHHCPLLTHVDVSRSATRTISALRHCPLLLSLDVSDTLVSDVGVVSVVESCTRLEHLRLGSSSTSNYHYYVTHESVCAALTSCPNLRSISTTPSIALHGALVRPHPSDGASTTTTAAAAAATSSSSPWALTHIELCRDHYFAVRDDDACAIGRTCPRLTCLKIQQCIMLTPSALSQAFTACSALTHLEVGECTRLNDACLDALARCVQLRHVTITFCHRVTDAGMRSLATHCPVLEHVDVRWCSRVSERGLSALLQRCVHLRHLSVVACNVRNVEMTDAPPTDVGAQQLALTHLDLSKCYHVVGVGTLVGKCPALRELKLRDCTNVRDADVDAIATSCLRLRHLDIFGCYDVTDVTLVVARCRHLERLDIPYHMCRAQVCDSFVALGRTVALLR